MEGYINEEEIFRDTRSSDRVPEKHSQVARETQSQKTATSGCHHSQVSSLVLFFFYNKNMFIHSIFYHIY